MGLIYTSIRAKNLDETIDFYTKKMVMKEIGRRSPIDGEIVALLVDKETGQRINVMWYDKTCRLYTPWKEDGVELDHLMFEVKDAKKTFDGLVKGGAPVAMPLMERDTPNGKFAMGLVKDPNGIWVGVRSGASLFPEEKRKR